MKGNLLTSKKWGRPSNIIMLDIERVLLTYENSDTKLPSVKTSKTESECTVVRL